MRIRNQQDFSRTAYARDNSGNPDIPNVSVKDPDFVMDMPLWEGPARNAYKWLVPGMYDATTEMDSFGTIVPITVVVYATVSFAADTDGIALSGSINRDPDNLRFLHD